MKSASIFIVFLLLAPISTFAQYAQPFPGGLGVAGMEEIRPNANTTYTAPKLTLCPVGLRAQHLSDGDLVKTAVSHPKGTGQALHLTLSGLDRGPVSEATILVHGFTPKGRLSQAASKATADATRSQHVHFAPGANQSADIWVAGLSAITSVEIVSATYADGSTWTPSGNLSCRVAPDLVMLVHH